MQKERELAAVHWKTRPTHTVSSSSTTVAQPDHTVEKPDIINEQLNLNVDQLAREVEMRVYGFHLFDRHHLIHAIVGAEGAKVSSHATEDQAH